MRFSIRKVDARDPLIRQALLVLHEEAFPLDSWASGFPRISGDWWIARTTHRRPIEVGLLGVKPINGTLYLYSVGVLPAYRGHGLMKALIRKAIAHFRELGHPEIVTDAVAHNAPSINSLIDCGFRCYVPGHPWALPNSVYWRKDL